jgi:ribokinase
VTGRVVVVGSLNVDLTVRVPRFPAPGETLAGSDLVTASGGKSANQAVAASVLGAEVVLVGAVGDDDHGSFLLDRVGGAGVDVAGVVADGEQATGTAMIVVDAGGENTIIISAGANGALAPGCVPRAGLRSADVLCLCLEVPVAVVLAAARAAHAVGAQVLLNLSPTVDVPDELLRLSDVLLVNAGEAAQLVGPGSWTQTRDRLAGRGVHAAVVTLGGAGSVVLEGAVTEVAAEPVEVVDTTGCGDAFTGAVACRLVAGDLLVDAARFASRASALAATAAGAQSSYPALRALRR